MLELVAAIIAFCTAIFVLPEFPPATFFTAAVVITAIAAITTIITTVAAVATITTRVLNWASWAWHCYWTWTRCCNWTTWCNNLLTRTRAHCSISIRI